MATSKIVKWTVVVVSDEDESLNKTYQWSSNTRLSVVMESWKTEHDLVGHWVFVSAAEDIIFYDNQMSLEMIGETAPRMICLRAMLTDEPTPRSTSEIFVYVDKRCHHLFVNQEDDLCNIVCRLPKCFSKCFQYNGLPLNLKHTVQQTKLLNKSVICEPLCSIAVKLSTGSTMVFQMPSDGLIVQLIEKINLYEHKDFSLRYCGRYLKTDESVRQLQHEVEVISAEFVIHFNSRRIHWWTKAEPITFSEFISQLALNGDIDTHELQTLKYFCIGCQRRIGYSEKHVQKLPIECCHEKSLALNVLLPSDKKSTVNCVQNLHVSLAQCSGKNVRTEESRSVSREMNAYCLTEGLDYNVLARCRERRLRIIELEENVETLKDKETELLKEIERLKTTNMKSVELLQEDNKKLANENIRIGEKNKKLGAKNATMSDKNRTLSDKIKLLTEENKKMGDEIKKLVDDVKKVSVEKNKLGEKNKRLGDNNKRLDDENKKLNNEIKKLRDDIKKLAVENKKLGDGGKKQDDKAMKLEDKSQKLADKSEKLEDKSQKLDYHDKKEQKQESDNKSKKLLNEQKKPTDEDKRIDDKSKKIGDNKNSKEDSNTVCQMKSNHGATNIGLSRPPSTPSRELGMKLFIFYDDRFFSPSSRSEVQRRGKYQDKNPHVKCLIPGLQAGPILIKDLCNVLQGLFNGQEIRYVTQIRGTFRGREFARVTSRDRDEMVLDHDVNSYCDVNGAECTYNELDDPDFHPRGSENYILLCGGGRRGILVIDFDLPMHLRATTIYL